MHSWSELQYFGKLDEVTVHVLVMRLNSSSTDLAQFGISPELFHLMSSYKRARQANKPASQEQQLS
jgi:hypothetical protein